MQLYTDMTCPVYHKVKRVYFVPAGEGWIANGCEDSSGAAICMACFEKAAEKLRKEVEAPPTSSPLSRLPNDPLSR